MKLWIFKALLLFCHCSVTLQQMVCSAVIFGRPIPHDCSVAIEGIKGAKDATSPEILVQRYFAEPQFMDPPFGALAPNPFNNDIVQMPKIWRFQRGIIEKPEIIYSWRGIVAGAVYLAKECSIAHQGLGGVSIVKLEAQYDGTLVFYQYEAGSPFEGKMNDYMRTGIPIDPHQIFGATPMTNKSASLALGNQSIKMNNSGVDVSGTLNVTKQQVTGNTETWKRTLDLMRQDVPEALDRSDST